MRIEQLQCFLEVARTGSITGAAQQLYISQQSASQSIKQLELELGCELLTRGKTGVGVTSYGKEVAETAKKILDEHNALQEKINMMKADKSSANELVFHITSTSPVINSLLPKIISDFDAKSKRLHIQLSVSHSLDDMIAYVQNGTCDIGLISYNEKELVKKIKSSQQELGVEILTHDEIVTVIDKKYYRGRYDYLSVEERQKYRITQYNILPTEEYAKYNGINCHIINYNDADFHRQMLEIGAIVIMPKLAYEYFFKNKNLIALPIEDVTVQLAHAVIYKNDNNHNQKEFAAFLRKKLQVK